MTDVGDKFDLWIMLFNPLGTVKIGGMGQEKVKNIYNNQPNDIMSRVEHTGWYCCAHCSGGLVWASQSSIIYNGGGTNDFDLINNIGPCISLWKQNQQNRLNTTISNNRAMVGRGWFGQVG